MKKKVLSLSLFLITFLATYLIICFAVPGIRIKLDVAPITFFVKSITHMVFFKATISLIAALIVGVLPFIFYNRK